MKLAIPRLTKRVSPRVIAVVAAAVIALAGLAAYGNSLAGAMVFDDFGSITDNPTIRHLWPIGPVLSPSHGGLTVGGRPVVNLSLAINYALGGTSVWGYHAFNLAVHLLAGLTLFGIVRRTLERAGRSDASTLLAFAVALLWTVHPLQTESVTYIIQRAESLMGLFYLLTLYCFIRFTERESSFVLLGGTSADAETGGVVWAWLSIVCCLLGMGTKEVMASAPVMVFLYDRTFFSGTFQEAWRRRWRYYLGLAGTWLLLGALVIKTGGRGGTAGFGMGISWWSYWASQFPAVMTYLRLSIWPHPLIIDYGMPWMGRSLEIAPSAAAVAALAAGAIYALFRPDAPGSRLSGAAQENGAGSPGFRGRLGARALGFAGAWFFAILAPTSLVLGTRQTMAEHRMYLALAPVMVILVWMIDAALRILCGRAEAIRRYLVLAVALAAAAVFGGLTSFRNCDYRSELALWSDEVAKEPGNPFGLAGLGSALYRAGRPAEARDTLLEAAKLQPNYPLTYVNLARASIDLGRPADAAAYCGQALRLRPGYADAQVVWGNALKFQGRIGEAVLHYQEAVRLDPDDPGTRNNLGLALRLAGKPREAIAEFEKALRLEPNLAAAHQNLGVALAGVGRPQEALEHLETAVRLEPASADAQYDLGVALDQTGRFPEAISHYEAAVRLAPANARAHDNLGVALARSGRAAEAMAQFVEAVRLEPDNPGNHRNLGFALRAVGKNEEASAQFAAAARLETNR